MSNLQYSVFNTQTHRMLREITAFIGSEVSESIFRVRSKTIPVTNRKSTSEFNMRSTRYIQLKL